MIIIIYFRQKVKTILNNNQSKQKMFFYYYFWKSFIFSLRPVDNRESKNKKEHKDYRNNRERT